MQQHIDFTEPNDDQAQGTSISKPLQESTRTGDADATSAGELILFNPANNLCETFLCNCKGIQRILFVLHQQV